MWLFFFFPLWKVKKIFFSFRIFILVSWSFMIRSLAMQFLKVFILKDFRHIKIIQTYNEIYYKLVTEINKTLPIKLKPLLNCMPLLKMYLEICCLSFPCISLFFHCIKYMLIYNIVHVLKSLCRQHHSVFIFAICFFARRCLWESPILSVAPHFHHCVIVPLSDYIMVISVDSLVHSI